MLYNALHIGDQLISIGGVTISSANEANKIIRNTQSLYVSFICVVDQKAKQNRCIIKYN